MGSPEAPISLRLTAATAGSTCASPAVPAAGAREHTRAKIIGAIGQERT